MTDLPARAGAKEIAHLIASALAWRGRVVFTFMEPANTNSPLQSLTTAVMVEKRGPTAASTFIFMSSLQGVLGVMFDQCRYSIISFSLVIGYVVSVINLSS